MNQHRRLALHREALTELTPGDLAVVQGALPISHPSPVCALLYPSGIRRCVPDPTEECAK